MNIFLICHVFPPEHAPAGVNYSELAEDLAQCGHKVTMITGWPSHPAGALYEGWRARFRSVEQMPEGYLLIRCGHSLHPRFRLVWKLWYYSTFAFSTLINGLISGSCDAILTSSTPVFGSLTSLLLAKIKGARMIYWIQDLHPESSRNAGLLREGASYRLMLALDNFVCRHSDLVCSLTDAMCRNIIERGISPDKVALLLHWVDSRKISPGQKDNPWSRQFKIPQDRFVVLHAGTIGWISGAEIIIESARRLRGRPDILFLIVGDGPLKEPMMKLASEHGLSNTIFLPFQPAEVLANVQATGDVGLVTLLPGTGESSVPSKMHGYTAAQRPVIASVAHDCPTAKMVRENGFGIVCPPQDAQALADAITSMADHQDEARRMGQLAREFFLRDYDRKLCTAQAEKMLTRLCWNK